MVLVFIRLVYKSTWFRFNKLLWFAFFFQGCVMVGRITYMTVGGHVGAGKITYMLTKNAGPGTTILALSAFLIYMHQLTVKYDQKDDQEFRFKELKFGLYWRFIYVCLIFSCYFGSLMLVSYWNGSMIEVELGNALALFVMCALYWIFGGGLILALEKINVGGDSEEDQIVPGK